jgi:hypothetical protein
LNPGAIKDLRVILNTSFIAVQDVTQEIHTLYSGGSKTWIANQKNIEVPIWVVLNNNT